MNKLFTALALLFTLQVRAAQHTVGGDTVVNATNGVANGLIQAAAKTFQASYTTTNAAISFAQSAYWSNNAAALRFNLTDLPSTSTEDRCIVTLVGQIGSVFTNVADSITWLGPWGQLNARTNTITVKWTGGALIAWQDPMHGVITAPQWVANTDNFDAGVADEVRVSTDAARDLTGVVGRPGGQQLTIENTGSFVITLKNNVTSTATNRFLFAQDIALGANQNITLIYDSTSLRWHPIALASVTEPNLLFTDVITANASTSQHGLLPKLDNTVTHFLNGQGGYTTPAGGTTLFRAYSGFFAATNSTTETNLFSFTLPANTLGTNKSIMVFMHGRYLNNSSANRTLQWKCYYGGTKIMDGTTAVIATQATVRAWDVRIVFSASQNSTSAQALDFTWQPGAATAPTTGYGNVNTGFTPAMQGALSTIDSTVDQTFTVSVTLSNAESTSYLWVENSSAKE